VAERDAKTPKEKATLGLSGPAIWNKGKPAEKDAPVSSDSIGVSADVSPETVQAAQEYLMTDVIGDENTNKPEPANKDASYIGAETTTIAGASAYKPQNTSNDIDGTSGEYQTEGVISSLEGFRFGQSTLISETGPKTNSDRSAPVLKVPKPGEPVSDAYAKSAAAGTDPKGVISSVIDMLEANNLYHPTENSPFFKGGSDNEGDATQGLFTIQRELGEFVAKVVDGKSSGKRVTANDMKLISQALLVRATGDYAGSWGLLSDDNGADVLANPLEQLGLAGVRVSNLNIRSMVGARGETGLGRVPKDLRDKILAATGGKGFMQLESGNGSELPFRGNAGTPYNSISHGQLNNYLEPFGNGVLLDSVGMLYLAVLAIASILVTG